MNAFEIPIGDEQLSGSEEEKKVHQTRKFVEIYDSLSEQDLRAGKLDRSCTILFRATDKAVLHVTIEEVDEFRICYGNKDWLNTDILPAQSFDELLGWLKEQGYLTDDDTSTPEDLIELAQDKITDAFKAIHEIDPDGVVEALVTAIKHFEEEANFPIRDSLGELFFNIDS